MEDDKKKCIGFRNFV